MRDFTASFRSRQGARIRSAANDIKRNAEALASELGEDFATIDAVFAGDATSEVIERVIRRMACLYPLSRLDLEVKRDDTDDGAVIWQPDQAQASSRVFSRQDRSGEVTPYYEYRDVAMSTVGPYRPEWIKNLRVVSSDDPADPDVAYNNGHLLHQITFFVGPVNFYWKIGNQSNLAKMSTGDSNYITPFVPHSFASRDANQKAYIIAVTFAGKLENIQQELAVLDPEGVEAQLLDLSDQRRAFSSILGRELANRMLEPEQMGAQTGIEAGRLKYFLDASAFPSMEELTSLSDKLGTSARNLLPPAVVDPREVAVKYGDKELWRYFPSAECPSYQVADLAGSTKIPYTHGLAVRVLAPFSVAEEPSLDLTAPAHEFAYNYGEEPAILLWQSRAGLKKAVIEPGASYYLKPAIPHALCTLSQSRPSDLVMVRVGGGLHGDAYLELSSLPRESIHRVMKETRQWYDPKPAGAESSGDGSKRAPGPQ